MISRLRSLRGEINFVLSNVLSLGVGLLSSVVAVTFIEPYDLGVINQYMLIQVYLSFLHLGVFNGLNRNLAYYLAKGETAYVQRLVNCTYTTGAVISFIGFCVGCALTICSVVTPGDTIHLYASLLLLFLLTAGPLVNALETTYRSGQQFFKLGYIKNIENTIQLVSACLPAVIGAVGKVISDSLKQIVGLVLRYRHRAYRYSACGDFRTTVSLIKVGFPILVTGYLWSVFMACDRTYISIYMGAESLGLYSLSGYVTTTIMAIPLSINALLYPKAAAKYGASNNNHDLFSFWKLSLMLYGSILLPICIITYFVLPFIVSYFMPMYQEGIEAAQYSLLTCSTFIYLGPAVIFGTLRRNFSYIVILCCSILVFWCTCYVFHNRIDNIETVALIRFIISFIQLIFILTITYIYVAYEEKSTILR